MILTRKRLVADIFLTRRISKALAFCKFASVNFEPWSLNKTLGVTGTPRLPLKVTGDPF